MKEITQIWHGREYRLSEGAKLLHLWAVHTGQTRFSAEMAGFALGEQPAHIHSWSRKLEKLGILARQHDGTWLVGAKTIAPVPNVAAVVATAPVVTHAPITVFGEDETPPVKRGPGRPKKVIVDED